MSHVPRLNAVGQLQCGQHTLVESRDVQLLLRCFGENPSGPELQRALMDPGRHSAEAVSFEEFWALLMRLRGRGLSCVSREGPRVHSYLRMETHGTLTKPEEAPEDPPEAEGSNQPKRGQVSESTDN